jgi:hypothetical protein
MVGIFLTCATRFMRTTNRLIAAAFVLGGSILACSLPGRPVSTPFIFPTPNLTETATHVEVVTPIPPVVHTATPVFLPSITPSESPTPTIPQTPFITQTPLTSEPELRQGPVVEAQRFSSPPLIDGDLNDFRIRSYDASHVVHGRQEWDNPADISADFSIGWDDDYLYLAAQVYDDAYVQGEKGLYIFRGDSLEILLDMDLAGDFSTASLNADDFQLGISPGFERPGNEPEAYLWYPSSISGPKPEVRIAAAQTPSGYQLEAAVPWSLFGINPREGAVFGFAFSVSDNDLEGESVQQSMISNVNTRRLGDPTTWGNLVLKSE